MLKHAPNAAASLLSMDGAFKRGALWIATLINGTERPGLRSTCLMLQCSKGLADLDSKSAAIVHLVKVDHVPITDIESYAF